MKYLFVFLFLTITTNLYAENKYDTFFSASIGKNQIAIVGEKKSDDKFYDNKILLLKDSNGKILDTIDIYYPDTNYRGSVLLSSNAFVLRITIREPYRNCFIYSDSRSNTFCYYDCSKWVADGIILDEYIIYSTEFDDNTIKRIDLNNNTTFSYNGYYPNVTIYEYNKNNILGVFKFEGNWFEIYKDEIKKSTEQFNLYKKNINDNYYKQDIK